MPRRSRATEEEFSLFPFLAVLLCTMGTLALVFVLVAQKTGGDDANTEDARAREFDKTVAQTELVTNGEIIDSQDLANALGTRTPKAFADVDSLDGVGQEENDAREEYERALAKTNAASLEDVQNEAESLEWFADELDAIRKQMGLWYADVVWEDAFDSVAADYPEIATEKINVDAAAMWLIKKPADFGVMLAPNLFGDILSDLAAGICGSLGFGAGGNINPNGVSMFEPIHGSAPKYAGKNIANPVATILAGALMLDELGEHSAAQRIETTVESAMREGAFRTHDIGGTDGTDKVGSIIRDRILQET